MLIEYVNDPPGRRKSGVSMYSNGERIDVKAVDYLDSGGSFVESSLLLANAVLRAIESVPCVRISLVGLKGASSSYFNVFLRRMEESVGIAQIDEVIEFEFGSRVQKMMYDASRKALERGVRKGNPAASIETHSDAPTRRTWLQRVFGGPESK